MISCWSVASPALGGMKSITSPTPDGMMNRVIRMRYSCLVRHVPASGAIREYPPLPVSRMEAKTLGESKRGQQYQSIVPSVSTRVAVCRSPMSPWSSMAA